MTDRDSAVLVNRGFVPAADGATPDRPVPEESGEVEITGIALEMPRTEDGGAPVTGSAGTSWRRLDLEAMRNAVPYPLLEIYVLAEPDSARRGWPRRVEPPPLSEGQHLSYALQWIGIAAAVLGFGLFVILGIGRRGGATVPPPPPPPAAVA
jgi:surfeit locus 1 family protein